MELVPEIPAEVKEHLEKKPRKPYTRTKPYVKRGKAVTVASAGSKLDAAQEKSATHKDPEIKTEYPLPERTFESAYSKVGVSLGMTRSLGNYEFARVDVYVEDFCEPDKKLETFNELHKQATSMVGVVVKDVDKFLEGKRKRDLAEREPSL